MELRELNSEQWQRVLSPAASGGQHRPPQGRRPEDPQWHPLRPGHWLAMDGPAQGIRLPQDGLTAAPGAGLPGRAAKAGGGGHRRHHRGGQDRGEGVGLDGFRRRKGSKVHALVAPPGLPLAVAIGPASSHDATAPAS
jgi:hypothetical protein